MYVSLSIISHRHGDAVKQLVKAFAALADTRLRHVIVTLNLPEPELARDLRRRSWPFTLDIVDNAAPKGFGANHNQAFALDARHRPSNIFAVVNPDIVLRGNPFDGLLHAIQAGGERVGASYPIQVDGNGRLQDFERLLPTPGRLLWRYMPFRGHRGLQSGERPDWVNAAFLLLRREAYASVGGFDEDFHMYCEDVDLCLRLRLAGWQLVRADEAAVVHGAQRASHSDLRHLAWHVRSLLQLWRSRAWRAYRAGHARDSLFLDSSDTR